ncbi:hippocampus abundant transcript-like protein 1 [Carica papaya]|uniref:hippocampus abundant transcript-like protein 1 n=1 Tax=Carica papaya TaxID=3649 RepID=UPI000B8C7D57|nr:hippocampus abundant transcript-like protein 1 [Carica papaya]
MEMGNKLRGLSHFFITVFLSGFADWIVAPAITDLTMQAVCPGQDQCPLAIYLSGFQQAVVGLGTLVMLPVIGNLSDKYGRKALLTVPMTLSIIPSGILAYSIETPYFYAYYVLKTLFGLVCEGSVVTLAHAYMADNVPEQQRASAFGILAGVLSASLLCGTLAARFLSTTFTFQVATVASIIGLAYMRISLKEQVCDTGDNMLRPILKAGTDDIRNDPDADHSPRTVPRFKNIPSIRDVICLLRIRSLQYFLRARFHFNQPQFAELMLIVAVAMAISQLLLMPALVSVISEEKLLSLGLFMSFMHVLSSSIAWAVWVPYASNILFAVFVGLVSPCIRSIASKQVSPSSQGMAQGCMSGIESFAQILSPLIFSPLTALFLSENAPFYFPGFSLTCMSLTLMVAFIQSLFIKVAPPVEA